MIECLIISTICCLETKKYWMYWCSRIFNKSSYPTIKCPRIIVWRRDLIIGLPTSDQRCKLIVKTAIMVTVKARIRTLHFPAQLFIKWDSPLIRSESCMSFAMIVTLLAWIAHKFASSKSPTLKASTDFCIADNDVDWKWFASWCGNETSLYKSCRTSLARHWNGILQIRSSELFW